MVVRLTLKQRGEHGRVARGQEFILREEVVTIGRDCSCHVVLSQSSVSRKHARITRDGALHFIEDLGTACGTLLNGTALPAGEKHLLRNGDTIAIAQFDLMFERLSELAFASDEPTSKIARIAVRQVLGELGAGTDPYFRVMNGLLEGQRIGIPDAQEIVIGREQGVEIALEDDLVSRRHAKVRRDWSGTHLEDLGSRNGVRVNQQRITTRKTLADRDEVEIGRVRLLYVDPDELGEPSVVSIAERPRSNGVNAQAPDVPGDVPAPPLESAAGPDAPSPLAAPPKASTREEFPPSNASGSGVSELKPIVALAVACGVAMVTLVLLVLVLAGA
jgi:pSer/pThr/pTyr-binding forkhead associated (FHA) protein